jgi:hypothetical protein
MQSVTPWPSNGPAIRPRHPTRRRSGPSPRPRPGRCTPWHAQAPPCASPNGATRTSRRGRANDDLGGIRRVRKVQHSLLPCLRHPPPRWRRIVPPRLAGIPPVVSGEPARDSSGRTDPAPTGGPDVTVTRPGYVGLRPVLAMDSQDAYGGKERPIPIAIGGHTATRVNRPCRETFHFGYRRLPEMVLDRYGSTQPE